MKSWTVVGYTYAADTYCPECTLEIVKARYPLDYPLAHTVTTADTPDDCLRAVAKSLNLNGAGIDVNDESTYDSDDFPKVVFVDQVHDDEGCARCFARLVD